VFCSAPSVHYAARPLFFFVPSSRSTFGAWVEYVRVVLPQQALEKAALEEEGEREGGCGTPTGAPEQQPASTAEVDRVPCDSARSRAVASVTSMFFFKQRMLVHCLGRKEEGICACTPCQTSRLVSTVPPEHFLVRLPPLTCLSLSPCWGCAPNANVHVCLRR